MREEIVFYGSLLLLILQILLIHLLGIGCLILLYSYLLRRKYRKNNSNQVIIALYAPISSDFIRFKYLLPCYIRALYSLKRTHKTQQDLKIYIFSHLDDDRSLLVYSDLISNELIVKHKINFIHLKGRASRYFPTIYFLLGLLSQIRIHVFINLSQSYLLPKLIKYFQKSKIIDAPYPTLAKPDYNSLPILSYEDFFIEKQSFVLILSDDRCNKLAYAQAQRICEERFEVFILRRANQIEERKDYHYRPFFISPFSQVDGQGAKQPISLSKYFYFLARASAMVLCIKNIDNSLTQLMAECEAYEVPVLKSEKFPFKTKLKGLQTKMTIFDENEDVTRPLKGALWDQDQKSTRPGGRGIVGVNVSQIRRYQEFKQSLKVDLLEQVMNVRK